MEFKPFTRIEWIITAALVFVAVGGPVAVIMNHQIERNRLESAFQKRMDQVDRDSRGRLAAK